MVDADLPSIKRGIMGRVFKQISSGSVYSSPLDKDEVALNPRCALLANGELVCSFLLQSGFGINDFKAMLSFSKDAGSTWSEPTEIWPHLSNRFSHIGQISVIQGTDTLLYFGTRIPIDEPGESYWRDDLKGIKQNELFLARSDNRGHTWTDPQGIPMPHAGSAEAQGPILRTGNGAWLACYAPYRTWDPGLNVELNCLMQLRSDDQGGSWRFQRLMTFKEPRSGAAEAWIAELADNLLISTCWHTNLSGEGEDFTNKYALSRDGGKYWSGPHDTGIHGQSTALLALNPTQVLMVYNQRKRGDPGIRGAVFEVNDTGLQIVSDEFLWNAQSGTRTASSGNHADWTDFSFGEPAMIRIDGQRLLLVFWEKGGPGHNGISARLFEKQ